MALPTASDNPFAGVIIRESANDGSDFSNPAADYRRLFLGEDGGLHLRDSAGAMTHIATGAGAAFPASPPTNSRFYRTDLKLEFVYDGTRWVTTHLYTDAMVASTAIPISATAASHRLAVPLAGSMSVWVENCWLSFYVTGGTALGASHKWVCVFSYAPAGTTLGTVNIDSGASDAHRNSGAVAAGVVVATTEFMFSLVATKTGTPGTLLLAPRISYRLIGT